MSRPRSSKILTFYTSDNFDSFELAMQFSFPVIGSLGEQLIIIQNAHSFDRPHESSRRITRGIDRKCSGEESHSERRRSSRSAFDKVVCSEPLAFAADAGLWVSNDRYGRLRAWNR